MGIRPPQSGTYGRTVSEVHGDTAIASDNTEKTLTTLAVPTTLKAGDRLVLRCSGDLLNNTGGSRTFTFKIKLGGTTIATSSAASFSSNASVREWLIEIVFAIVDPAASQLAAGFGMIGTAGNFQWNSGSAVLANIQGSAAEDLTSAKNALLTITQGTADTTCTLHQASLALLPS